MIQDFHSELLTSEVTESMRNNSLTLNVLSKGLQCASWGVLLSDWEFSTTTVVRLHHSLPQHHRASTAVPEPSQPSQQIHEGPDTLQMADVGRFAWLQPTSKHEIH